MTSLMRGRALAAAAFVVAALAGEAASLPDGMTLPATYRVRGTATVVMVARAGNRTRTWTRTSRSRDTLTLDDGTFSFEKMVGDGDPATGTWTETDTNVLARTYDIDVDGRLADMLERELAYIRGFRNADVTCLSLPRAVTVRRGGNRVTGVDKVKYRVTGGVARMSGSVVFRWTGRRTD